jgi:hypothetical protein
VTSQGPHRNRQSYLPDGRASVSFVFFIQGCRGRVFRFSEILWPVFLTNTHVTSLISVFLSRTLSHPLAPVPHVNLSSSWHGSVYVHHLAPPAHPHIYPSSLMPKQEGREKEKVKEKQGKKEQQFQTYLSDRSSDQYSPALTSVILIVVRPRQQREILRTNRRIGGWGLAVLGKPHPAPKNKKQKKAGQGQGAN